MPPQQQNQYDFITNSPKQPRRQINFGKSPRQRIVIVAVGVVFLIIAATMLNSFLNRGSKAHAERLTEVVQAQNEIIRVSALAVKDAKSDKTKNYALNTKVSVQSSQNDVKALLAKRGIKAKGLTKKLAASKNTKNDQTLKDGGLNNRYDETYTALTNKQLADYQKLVTAAYASSNPAEKTALTISFQNAGKLAVKDATKQ